MFDFAWSHYALLLIVAVVLLGPKEIPVVLRFVGRWVGKIRILTSEWREYIDHISQEAPDQPVTQIKKDKPDDKS